MQSLWGKLQAENVAAGLYKHTITALRTMAIKNYYCNEN